MSQGCWHSSDYMEFEQIMTIGAVIGLELLFSIWQILISMFSVSEIRVNQ